MRPPSPGWSVALGLVLALTIVLSTLGWEATL